MLNFKHFPKMDSSAKELFFGKPSVEDLRYLLPLALPDLIRSMGAGPGLVTLASLSEIDVLEEVASWGYEEEGFFYPFLAKGSLVRTQLETSDAPFFFSDEAPESVTFYKRESVGCLLCPIQSSNGLAGFILLEISMPPADFQLIQLGLFCQKLSSILEPVYPKAKPILSAASATRGKKILDLGEVLFSLIQDPNGNISKFEKDGVLAIVGPRASGKKAIAKWIHRSQLPGKGVLVLSTIPEGSAKIERSLKEWGGMTPGGTLIFDHISDFSLVQQRAIYEFVISQKERSKVILLQNSEQVFREEFPLFKSLLDMCSLSLPTWQQLTFLKKQELIVCLFGEVKEALGRRDLILVEKAIQQISDQKILSNLEEVRNSIEAAVLLASGSEISELEMKSSELQKGLSLPEPEDLDLRKAVEAVERQKILLAHKLFGGNQIRMAKALQISRGSLQYKLRNFGIG
ncbi:hypothetical protein CH373_07520 [Leptospira perolatii]|uniref:DNA binding HTH domain-containing protein n=1 Tax=Leptospira perolatii TaxID=2023191 RepID=A0A2M9ZPR6_9LEPT|nr:helix-turn-helix domain-containing protein [Leptospira perolatii]PJZ70944.1 hypothetical protein CH360_04380 [Leptospira perolatii]PJZ74070.1 hypothetical protein CH373_07520 [Leptospira perolatii]